MPDAERGYVMKQSEQVDEPEHDGDDHDPVQDGLDGSLHGDKAVDQPQ